MEFHWNPKPNHLLVQTISWCSRCQFVLSNGGANLVNHIPGSMILLPQTWQQTALFLPVISYHITPTLFASDLSHFELSWCPLVVLVAPQVVIMTTCDATSDGKVHLMTALSFQVKCTFCDALVYAYIVTPATVNREPHHILACVRSHGIFLYSNINCSSVNQTSIINIYKITTADFAGIFEEIVKETYLIDM